MSALASLLPDDDSLVVTDTETTGVHAHQHRIIEVAGTRIGAGNKQHHFAELINPGTSVPYRITRITGITTAMVFDRPDASVVIPRFREFLGDGLFVAHNIRFDWGFLNAELERLDLPPLDNRRLCTLRLARRLLPGLRSKSLGSLAAFYKIPPDGRHRAAKDVSITVTVLERFAEMAIEEHGVTEIAELLELQGRTYARVNPHSKHVVLIKRDRLPELPACPGVYFMRDGRGKVLYVGKARDLSKRVTSYFNAIEAHPPRIRQLIAKVRDVTWDELPTELHALIEESRQIKTLDPSFNRAQKRYIARPYLRLDPRHEFPRLTVQVIMRDDGAEYYGPFRSRGQAHSLLELIEAVFPVRNCPPSDFERGRRCVRADIGRCPAPCTGTVEPLDYRDIIDRVRQFLRGNVDEVADQLEADMLEAAETFRFEDAAKLRDWITLLEERVAQGGAVAQEVSGPEVIHFLKARDGELATLVVMAAGRIHTLEALEPDDPGGHIIRDALMEIESDNTRPTGLRLWEADARRLLDHWLHVYRNDVVSVERRSGESLPMFAERTEMVIRMHLDASRHAADQPNIQRTT